MADVPKLAEHEGSWVVVRKGTLDAVLETYEESTVRRVNENAYDVLTIGNYLGSLNARLKQAYVADFWPENMAINCPTQNDGR